MKSKNSNVQFVRKVRTKKPKTTTTKKKPIISKKLTKKELEQKPLSYQMKYKLKQNGITDVSVRERPGGYSRAFYVRVPKEYKEQARQLLAEYEDYETDIRTGEILNAGNTYVFISEDF